MTKTRGRTGQWKPLLLPGLLATLLTLSGCSTLTTVGDSADAQVADVNEEVVVTGQRQAEDDSLLSEPPPPPLRPFKPETLFDLLVADMAGARNQYALQLNRYHKQAFATRDPGLAAQATWLAMQLNAAPQALELAQLWVSLAPKDADANRIVAHYLAHAQKLPQALPYALFAVRHDDAEAINTIASLLNRSNDSQQQEMLMQLRALAGDRVTNRPEVILLKANLLRLQGQYQQAIAEASRIQQPEASRESALLTIAQALLQRDGIEAALASLEQSLLLMPDSKRLRLQLARQWAEKDLERSREELNKLVTRFPDDHRLIYTLAMINAQLGFPQQAIPLLQRLLDNPQHRDNAYFQLGRLLDQQGEKAQAMEHYRQVQSGQHAATALSRLIQLLAEAGNKQEIKALLQRLRQRQPGNDAGAYLLVTQSLNRQHPELAGELLNEALGNHPNSTELLYERSMVNEQIGDTANSHRDLRAIIKLDPNHSAALNALGYSLCNNSSQYQEAYQLISKALELDPESPAILDSLGWALFRLNRYQEALPYLRKALEKLPDPEVAAHLGEVLWVMGNREEALKVWRQNLADNPGPSFVTRTMERLEVPQGAGNEVAR